VLLPTASSFTVKSRIRRERFCKISPEVQIFGILCITNDLPNIAGFRAPMNNLSVAVLRLTQRRRMFSRFMIPPLCNSQRLF
jgi:hypothetical protein